MLVHNLWSGIEVKNKIKSVKQKIIDSIEIISSKKSKLILLYLLIFGSLLLLIYSANIFSLVTWWIKELRYQMIVLILCIIMTCMRLKEALSIIKKPNLILGTGFLIIGLLIFVSGKVIANHLMQELSFVVVLAGIIVQFHSLNLLKHLFLPLNYLLFASHIFYYRPEIITYKLQLISAKLTVFILNLFGLNIQIFDTFIRLPATTLHVVDLCSGYNQLFTLIALMIPITYIKNKTAWQQGFIILLCFPVGLFMNSLRISGIAIYNYSNVHDQIHGPFDVFRMPFIFLGGFICLALFSRFLEAHFNTNKAIRINNNGNGKNANKSAVIFTVAILGIAAIFTMYNSLYPFDKKTRFSDNETINQSWCLLNKKVKHLNYKSYYNIPLNASDEVHFTTLDNSNNVKTYVSVMYFHKQLPANEPFFFNPDGEITTKGKKILSQKRCLYFYKGVAYRENYVLFKWFLIDGFEYCDYWSAVPALITQLIKKGRTDCYLCLIKLQTKNVDEFMKINMEKELEKGIELTNSIIKNNRY